MIMELGYNLTQLNKKLVHDDAIHNMEPTGAKSFVTSMLIPTVQNMKFKQTQLFFPSFFPISRPANTEK